MHAAAAMSAGILETLWKGFLVCITIFHILGLRRAADTATHTWIKLRRAKDAFCSTFLVGSAHGWMDGWKRGHRDRSPASGARKARTGDRWHVNIRRKCCRQRDRCAH